MRAVVSERIHHRHRLLRRINTHMHMHPKNDHVPAPVLGTVHHPLVAVLINHRLLRPPGIRVSSRAEKVQAHLITDRPQRVDGLSKLTARLGDGGAHPGNNLQGIIQKFAGHMHRLGRGNQQMRVPLTQACQHLLGTRGELAICFIGQRELPLHADCGLGRVGKSYHFSPDGDNCNYFTRCSSLSPPFG